MSSGKTIWGNNNCWKLWRECRKSNGICREEAELESSSFHTNVHSSNDDRKDKGELQKLYKNITLRRIKILYWAFDYTTLIQIIMFRLKEPKFMLKGLIGMRRMNMLQNTWSKHQRHFLFIRSINPQHGMDIPPLSMKSNPNFPRISMKRENQQ